MSFSAYNRNNKPPPRNYYTPRNRNSNDPPEILPEFRSTPESMQRSYIARQQDQHDRAVRQQIENEIRYHEERSEYGMKQINPDEFDDDDEHAIPMAPVYSRFNPPQPQQIIREVHYLPRPKKHKKEKKTKKHKKRSSSSSDESGKRKRKRHQSREDGNSGDESSGNGQGTSSSSAKRPRTQDSLNEVSKNPFKLLRVGELKYSPSHLVEDRKHDLENRKYDAAYKHEVPMYKGRNKLDCKKNLRVASERFPELMKNWHIAHKDRLFNHCKKWNIGIERKCRQRPDELGDVDCVQISRHKLDGVNGAASVKIILDDNMCNDMNAEDYEHFVKSQTIKCQEPEPFGLDIKDQYSVLHNRVTMNKLDVDGWMEFIDIQRPIHAKNESGDQNAGIQNRKAYYERVTDIVKKAIAANPGNGDLQIKKLQIMQEHFGVNSPEVKQEWARLENHLVNSIQMWEGNLKMCFNDRSMFKLDQAIKKIDRCLNKLASLKYGMMRSHPYLEGTDEFMVNLLVIRCRLLIATGHLDKAIGMLQALAEFHFFRPTEMDTPRRKAERWILAKEQFKKFWESGNLRIGEESAEGWIKYDEFNKQEEWRDDEEQILDGSMNEIFGDEQSQMEECKKTEGTSLMEARCRLEEYRSKHYWKPIYFEHDNKDLFMFDTRIIKFSDIEHVLFPLDDDQLIQDLIFKLFHIFGIPIPGLKFNSQEDVLRSFSPDLFQSRRPNALGLAKFDAFFTYFIKLLAESPHMDSARIYTALATMISTSAMEKNKKIKQLKELRNDAANKKLKRCYLWTDLPVSSNPEYLLSILVVVCDELWKLQKGADYNTMLSFLKYLNTNLDAKNSSLWDIGVDVEDPKQKKLKMCERIFTLRFILYIVRNLPFSDEEGAATKMQNIKKKEEESPATKTFILKTRREFLLSLWANGNITEVPDHQEEDAIERAKERVTKCLKKGAPRDLENLQWRWIGNEPEIVFELAALFCYEFPFKSEVQRYKFFQEDTPLFNSELANSLSDSPVIQEIRVKVLQHIMEVRRGLEFTPSNLVDFLNHQVQRFPHSIPLLKTLIDITKGFNERVYLYKNPGNDDLTQLIRSCSEIYVQRLKLQNEMDELNKEERDRIVENSLRIFKKMADKNSNTLFMDDYIWTILMRIAVLARESITNSKITEIFNLGQKVCPWSKELLFNAVRNRAATEEASLLTIMNELMSTHGIHQYVCDSEVLTYMTEQIS